MKAEILQEKKQNWFLRHLFLVIVIPCSLIVVSSGVVSGLVLFLPKDEVVEEAEPEEPEKPAPVARYFSRLTGLSVATADEVGQATNCIMIENSYTKNSRNSARPQSGLVNAGVIYEAVAEGGITRFMAVYQGGMPEFIGPVRSLRMYYAEWARPYECLIAHAGGADDAIALVRNGTNGFRTVSENNTEFWRIRDRYAPHNLYTSGARLEALMANRGYTASNFEGFARAIEGRAPTRSRQVASNINITMSGAEYNVSYAYDTTTNTYLRAHQTDGAHMDRDINGALTQNAPKVVVAMMVTDKARAYSPYRNVETNGTGVAHVFQNGEYMAATWTKNSMNDELRFVGANGKPIVFNSGQIWISAVPVNKSVIWQ